MKITPAEIREKHFEKNFRGYDKDEVTDFLKFISAEFESLTKEKEDLARRLETSEKEANKLKEVEESLFRTLKTAEDTGAAMIEEASKSSEEILSEAHQNADTMVQDAQRQAQNLIESAEEKSRKMMDDLKADIKGLVEDYTSLLAQRDLVLKNLKALSEDINDNISVSQESFKKINVDIHAEMVEKLSKSNAFTMAKIAEVQHSEPQLEPRPEEKAEKTPPTEDKLEEAKQEKAETSNNEEEKPSKIEASEETEPVKKDKAPENVKAVDVSTETIAAEKQEEAVEKEDEKKQGNKGGSFFDQFD